MLINQSSKHESDVDRLSLVFMALADPTRRQILEILSKGEATVSELAANFSLTLPAISRHLKVLERARLISRGRNAQWRPCRLELGALREGADYMDRYRKLWETSLVNLSIYVQELQRNGKKERKG